MEKNLVIWKKVRCKIIDGSEIYLEVPELVDVRYRGTLLSEILAMPKKKALLFDDAIRMLSDAQMEAFDKRRVGNAKGEYHWLTGHFIEWISDQGFHIELTGDEFLSYRVQQLS